MEKRDLFRKYTGIFGMLVLLAVGLFLFGRHERKEETVSRAPVARPVKTVMLSAPAARDVRTYPGKILASQRVDLAFRVSGPLVELPVRKAQNVAKGDLLARLDPRDFEIQLANAKSALANAQAQLAAMRAGARKEEVSALSSQLASARARMEEAEAQYRRFERLYKEGAIAAAEFDRYKTAYEVSKAAVNEASQELQKAKAGARPEDIQAMEATIRGLESSVKAAESALSDTELRAPFDGIVADRYVENFQSIQRDQPILALQDLKDLEVVISVPEQDLTRARSADAVTVQVRFENIPGKTFPANFKEVATQADPQTQTYPVTFRMPYPEELTVLPGMTVEVLLGFRSSAAGDGGFVVPTEAVAAGEGTSHFLLVVDEPALTVRRVPVDVLSFRKEDAVVSGDLEPGIRVVVAGVSLLAEGEAVTLYAPEETPLPAAE